MSVGLTLPVTIVPAMKSFAVSSGNWKRLGTTEKIRLSRNRVDRLGYFTNVGIDTQEVAGSSDQVDLTVTVAEKPTGSISLGAGISSADGLGLSFGFKQENAFGSGSSLVI